MNNEQQTWILKPGVRITNAGNFFTLSAGDEKTYVVRSLKNIEFNTLFTELDVSGLTRQVEESLTFLCQYAYDAGYTTGDDRTVTGKDVDLSVKATALKIVGLLLNQEKETK